MTSWQIQREPVVGNHSVADATTGVRLRTPNQIPSQLGERSAGLLLGSCALTFQPAQDGVALPPAWPQILQTAQWEGAEPTWQLHTGRRRWWARHGDEWYFLRPDNRLRWMEGPPPGNMLVGARFEPACVVRAPRGSPRAGSATGAARGRSRGPGLRVLCGGCVAGGAGGPDDVALRPRAGLAAAGGAAEALL